MTDDQLAELECHLAAGTDVATALAVVEQPAPSKPSGRLGAWLGLLIGLAIFIAIMVLWL